MVAVGLNVTDTVFVTLGVGLFDIPGVALGVAVGL